MKRCTAHGLLNCRCQEPLTAYLARQFRESGNDRVGREQLGTDRHVVDGLEPRVFDGRGLGRGERK